MGQFIFICNFLAPGKARVKGQRTLASIGRHIEYIATRPGVELNEETRQMADLQYQTSDVQSQSEKDLLEDFDQGEDPAEAPREKDLEKYVQYIHERPKSHGLFGPDEDTVPDMNEVKQNLMNHKGLVWTSILSLTEEDAVKLGYTTKEAWEKTIRATVTEAAGKMGIRPTNLDYVAAFHQKEGHPHVHLVFWEKNPDRTRGVLSNYERTEMRKIFLKEIYAEENSRLYAQKTAVRDYIRDVAKGEMTKTVDFIRGIRAAGLEVQALNGKEPGIAPIFRDEKQRELYIKLMGLAEKLPGTGRIQLKYMPQEVKDEVKNIADWLLNQPGLVKSVDELKEVSKEITLHYSKNPEVLKEAQDKAYNDVRDRVSQVLLKAAVEGQKDSIFSVNEEKAAKAIEAIKQADKPLNFDKEKELAAKSFIAAMNENKMERPEIAKALDQWNEQTNAGLSKEQCNTLKGYILNEKDISFSSLGNLKNTSEYKKAKIMAASLKATGMDKEAAETQVKAVFSEKLKALQNKIDTLEKDGFLVKSEKSYEMTDKLKTIFSKIRVPEKLERSILALVKEKEIFTDNDLLKSKAVVKNAGELYSQQREFSFGKYDANVVFRLFKNNVLTPELLKERLYEKYTDEVKAEEEVKNITGRIEKLVNHGYVEKDTEEGTYTITRNGLEAAKAARQAFEFTSFDANVVFGYINRAKGSLNSERLENMLTDEYKDPAEAKAQLEYLIKRLDNNVGIGTVEQSPAGEYKITDQGRSGAEVLLTPYKSLVVNQLAFLVSLGILEHDISKGEYRISNKELLEQTLENRHLNLKDTPLDKELYKLLNDTRGHINASDIEKRQQEYIAGIIKDYEAVKTDYESMREQYRVESTTDRVLSDMSKILVSAGLERDVALNIILDWNMKSGAGIEKDTIEEALDKAINARDEQKVWNREQVMSTKQWKEFFNDLGVDPEKVPKWMYEGQFERQSSGFLNQAWKAAFRAIQKECAKSEAQAELSKRQDLRQNQLENEAYRRELIKKMKEKAIFEEQEFD